MDKTNSNTEPEERKRGQHLGAEERGAIQRLKRMGAVKTSDCQSNRLQSIHCRI